MTCEDQALSPFPKSCPVWPCSSTPEKAVLKPNEKGFWCCPLCGGSYGRKEEPPNRPGVSA